MKLLIKCLVYIVMISLVTGCGYIGSSPNSQPPNTNIPAYPNAEHLTTQNLPPNRSSFIKETKFQTKDSREQILTFYKTFLLSNGWDIQSDQTPIPDGLYFLGGTRTMSSTYLVKLIIKSETTTNTVELTLYKDDPE